jgi:hypothetical protein
VTAGRVAIRIDELVLEGVAGNPLTLRGEVERELARYVGEHGLAPRPVATERIDGGTVGTRPAEIAAAVGRSLPR